MGMRKNNKIVFAFKLSDVMQMGLVPSFFSLVWWAGNQWPGTVFFSNKVPEVSRGIQTSQSINRIRMTESWLPDFPRINKNEKRSNCKTLGNKEETDKEKLLSHHLSKALLKAVQILGPPRKEAADRKRSQKSGREPPFKWQTSLAVLLQGESGESGEAGESGESGDTGSELKLGQIEVNQGGDVSPTLWLLCCDSVLRAFRTKHLNPQTVVLQKTRLIHTLLEKSKKGGGSICADLPARMFGERPNGARRRTLGHADVPSCPTPMLSDPAWCCSLNQCKKAISVQSCSLSKYLERYEFLVKYSVLAESTSPGAGGFKYGFLLSSCWPAHSASDPPPRWPRACTRETGWREAGN